MPDDRRLRPCVLVLLLGASLALGSCGRPEAVRTVRGRPSVLATTLPLATFARRIAGGAADVACPAPPSAEAFLTAAARDPSLLAAYQEADLVVMNGAGFETWAAVVSLPVATVVETARALEDGWIRLPAVVTHAHGPAGAHAHEGIDPYTWLDPLNAKVQAAAIRDALAARWPEEAAGFAARYEALARDLDDLDRRWKEATGAYDGRPLLAAHPTFAYLARRYGWTLVPVELARGAVPTPEVLTRLGEGADTSRARIVLWDGPPEAPVEAALKRALALTSVVIDPGLDPTLDGGEDTLARMRRGAERLAEAFEERR